MIRILPRICVSSNCFVNLVVIRLDAPFEEEPEEKPEKDYSLLDQEDLADPEGFSLITKSMTRLDSHVLLAHSPFSPTLPPSLADLLFFFFFF